MREGNLEGAVGVGGDIDFSDFRYSKPVSSSPQGPNILLRAGFPRPGGGSARRIGIWGRGLGKMAYAGNSEYRIQAIERRVLLGGLPGYLRRSCMGVPALM